LRAIALREHKFLTGGGDHPRRDWVRAMDIGVVVASLLAVRIGEMQLAAAAKLAKMQADNGQAVVKLIGAADQNANRLATLAAGLGGNIDVSA
jgi:hypothetical protein